MRTRIAFHLLIIGLLTGVFASAQVKIGDNPQNIDAASVLELESTNRVLVITRVDAAQMAAIVPNPGALVYNTSEGCVFYYNGTEWINLCNGATGSGGNFTTEAIANVGGEPTIVITPTATGNNFEVAPNSITTDQITNGSIFAEDLNLGALDGSALVPNSITRDKLRENSIGPFAIDRDSLPLSFFINDAGFITGANVVSADADNAIIVGGDGGAFYNDVQVQDNTAAIAALDAANGDSSPTNEIQDLAYDEASRTLSLSQSGEIVVFPAGADEVDGDVENELTDLTFDETTNILSLTNGATDAGSSVDLSTLDGGDGGGGVGGDDNQNMLQATLSANNVLTIPIENGAPTSVDLSALAGDNGGAGGAVDQTAAEVPVTNVPASYTPSAPNVEAHLIGIDGALAEINENALTTVSVNQSTFSGNGADENLDIQDSAIISEMIEDGAITPAKIEVGTANQILRTSDDGAFVEWVDLPEGTVGEVITQTAAEIPFTPAGNTESEDVQAAIVEIQNEIDGLSVGGGTNGENVNQTAAQVPVTLIATGYATANQDVEAHLTGINTALAELEENALTAVAINQSTFSGNGADEPLDIEDGAIISEMIEDGAVTPAKIEVGTANQILQTSDVGIVEWVDFPTGTGGESVNQTAAQVPVTLTATGYVATSQDVEAHLAGINTALANGGAGSQEASAINYTNDDSALEAENVQAAIDEVVEAGNEAQELILTGFVNINNSITNINGSIASLTGANIAFDDTTSGLAADNVQQAIDQLASAGGSDDQNIEGSILTGEVLTIGIEGGVAQDVDLASLATDAELSAAIAASETIIDAANSTVVVTGTGTTAEPYVLTAAGGDGSETIIDALNSTVGVTGTGTTAEPYVLTATAGDGSETVIDALNSTVGVTGTGTTAEPYVLTATAGDGSETVIDALNSTVGVTGTGTTAEPYVLTATGGDGSETIIDALNSTVGVTGTGTIAEPYVLTATAADGSETIIDAAAVVGPEA